MRARVKVGLLGLGVLVVVEGGGGLLWGCGVGVDLFGQGDGLVEKAALVLVAAILVI